VANFVFLRIFDGGICIVKAAGVVFIRFPFVSWEEHEYTTQQAPTLELRHRELLANLLCGKQNSVVCDGEEIQYDTKGRWGKGWPCRHDTKY
jgi:hypothetical protein